MLENLYTTKMSGGKKVLQNRFAKIRSKNGKSAKMMSLVMTFVLALALGTATVVMAAAGADGLEHWDKNEVYFRDEIDFCVNLHNQDVPQWLKENISGKNEIVNFKIKNYEVRYTDGMVNYGGFAEVSGKLGTYIFPTQLGIGLPEGIGSSLYSESDLKKLFDNTNAAYFTGLSFTKGNGSGYIMASRLVANEYSSANNIEIGAGEDFEVLFGFSEDNRLISIGFVSQHNVNGFYYIPADMTSVKTIRNIESKLNDEWLLAPAGGAFTSFEKNYTNRYTDKIRISLKSATKYGFVLNAETKPAGNYRINANVYRGGGSKIIGTERAGGMGEITIGLRDNIILKTGEVCRIDLYIVDTNNSNVVYRWQKYIKI